MADTAITELEELGAEKVSGVGSPANGTPWLLLKSTDVQADPDSPHTESPEADAQEDAMTKAEADEIEALLTKAEGAGFCGVDDCEVCKERFGDLHGELLKRKLRMADRKKIPKGDFAVPSKAPASGSYPINDESHARNALARASGKPVEAQVRAAVRRKYPNIAVAKVTGPNAIREELGLQPLQKSPGVPDEATATPKERGHLDTGRSGLAGPVTAGTKPLPAQGVGGESPYVIPDEAKVTDNPPYHAEKSWEIEVVDKQNWVSLDNNPAMAPQMPSEPSVEAANTTVLDRIVCAYMALKEAMAAQKADPDGMNDPLDAQVWAHLEDVCATLKNALIDQALDIAGVEPAMLKAENLLTKLGGANTTAGNGARTSEEENIMTTVTKEDLTSLISETAGAAAVTAVKEAFKAERKAEKAKMKGKMKGKKPPFMQAEKNANNGGDITAEQENSGVKGKTDAENVNSVGGPVDSQYINKEKTGKKDKALKEMADTLAAMNEKVTKMAARPRSGGPVLDGQARGAYAASEGRQTETVAKGAGDAELERLEKEIEKVEGRSGHDNAAKLSDLQAAATYRRLLNAHEAGIL